MKSLIFLTVLFSLFFFSFGQAEKVGTFGTDQPEIFEVSTPTLDGGCIVGGTEAYYMIYAGNSIEHEKGTLVKLDSAGLTEWAYRFEETDGDAWLTSVSQSEDGSFFVLGVFYATDSNWPRIVLVKLDGNGHELWQKSYLTGSSFSGSDIYPTSDGGAVIAGWAYSSYYNGDEMLVLKIDANGFIDWQAKYGQYRTWSADHARRIIQTDDGGYLVVGSTFYYNYYTGNLNDVLVMRLDSRGGIIWQKSFGTSDDEYGIDVVESGDGGFLVVAGNSYGYYLNTGKRAVGISDSFSWLFKINGSGNIVWQRRYGEGMLDYFTRATRLDTGGYLVSGSTTVPEAGGIQGRLIRIDDNGLVEWQKSYGGSNDESIISAHPLNERQLMAVGVTNSFGSGWTDGLVMILSNEGNISNSCPDNAFFIQDIVDTSFETTVSGFESKLRRKTSAVELSGRRVLLVPYSLDESLICERIKK